MDADKEYAYEGDGLLNVIEGGLEYVFEQPESVFNTYTVNEWLFSGVPLKCADIQGTNSTDDGRYTVNTGTVDPRRLGWIEMWNDSTTLPYWFGPECNQIMGTDAAIFPPFLTPESRIDIFSTDLCRSLYAVYQKDIEYKNIPGYRYVASEEQLATAE
ncbi:hypothetical protein B566_EDAN013164, partial [Ephemera danica]